MKFLVAFIFVFAFYLADKAQAYPENAAAGKLATIAVAIASSGTTSATIDLHGYTLVGIRYPAALTSTTNTFTMSETFGGTYVPVYNAAGAVSYTVAQGRYYAIDPKDFYGVQYLKLVLGSSEGAGRTIYVMVKAM